MTAVRCPSDFIVRAQDFAVCGWKKAHGVRLVFNTYWNAARKVESDRVTEEENDE